MNARIISGIIVLALLISGGYYFYRIHAQPAAQGTPTSGKIVPVWSFADAGTDSASGAPRTQVRLTLGGTAYDAGSYIGSCAEIGADGVDGTGLAAGEVSGVQCWFAGGGDEVGLFEEGGSLVLKHGELGEPEAETPGFRGNFTTLVAI
jgi:hypothetical protein